MLTLKVKSKEKPICKICDKVFRVKSGLKKHMEKHCDLKEFDCSLCPKQFKRSEALKSHLKAHKGIYDVKCLQCEKTFVSSSSLHCMDTCFTNIIWGTYINVTSVRKSLRLKAS